MTCTALLIGDREVESDATQTVIGFCPQQYITATDYLFVEVAGAIEPKAGRWLKVPSPITVFPPKGTIFVPPHLIPDFFEGQSDCAAAWTVVDQPDWAEVGIGARYRAKALAHCPAELVNIPCQSSDFDATRRLLLYDGIDHVGGVQGRESLIKFTDDVLAGPLRLIAKAGVANRYYCTEAALSNPIAAWPLGALDFCRFNWKGFDRAFLARAPPLPEATFYLDYASLEAILGRTQLSGGIGAGSGTALVNAKALANQLSHVLAAYPNTATFNARRDRLANLLDTLSEADQSWESWLAYLGEHPRFQEAVASAVNEKKASLEVEVRHGLAESERELLDQITEFEHMSAEAEQQLRILEDEISLHSEQRYSLLSDVSRLQGDVEKLAHACNGDDNSTHSIFPNHNNQLLHIGPAWADFTSAKPLEISSPEQAIAHLQENLNRVGLLTSSSLELAREVYVAASLGQAVFFRGSFASQLSELVAISFSGLRWCRLGVELGAATSLCLPQSNNGPQIGAIVLEGVNRSCFDVYGGAIARILSERTLGLLSGGFPIIIGTIHDGPSSLPPGGTLTQLGLNCNTDLLSWRPRRGATVPLNGNCTEPSWKATATKFTFRIPESVLKPTLSIHWHRNVISAGEVLSTFDRNHALVSLLCGWVIPYLTELVTDTLPSELVDEFGVVLDNPRVIQHLGAAGIEVMA